MSQFRTVTGRWISVCFCSACNQRLSRSDIARPSGRCPHCGTTSEGPIPRYYTRQQRTVTTYRKSLGLFWVRAERHIESRGD